VRSRVFALALVALMAPALAAQNCQVTAPPGSCTTATLTTPATITIPRTVLLTMSTTTTAATSTIADFDNSGIDIVGPTATINGNRAWTLLMAATATTLTNTGVGSRPNKPTSDITWSTAAAGTFVPLTTTSVQLATGTATNSTVTSLFYRVALDWTLDKPGTYSVGVTFTLTTP